MFKKAKTFIVAGIMGLMMIAPGAVPSLAAVAAADTVSTGLCQGTNIATGTPGQSCTGGDTADNSIAKIANQVVNIFSIIVGVVAVIMIIYGGFKYITSGGDSGNVSSAKNTLIYAVIGLIIVALSQFIVHVVLNTSNKVVSP